MSVCLVPRFLRALQVSFCFIFTFFPSPFSCTSKCSM